MENVRTLATSRLKFEVLEDRIAPVVGAFSFAPPVLPGTGFDGVALVQSANGMTNTGTLLATGRHVLTAAHSADVNGDRVADGPMQVRFDTPTGTVNMSIDPSAVYISPGWVGLPEGKIPRQGHDWAVITLPEEAPAHIERFDLYRGSDEVGRVFTLIGYGVTGDGSSGSNMSTVGVKRSGINRFDADTLNLGGDRLPPRTGLIADFDNGSPTHDAFGSQFGIHDTGFGADEAMVGPGDSGGPALINVNGRWLVAGVASFAVTSGSADIDNAMGQYPRTNNSFGEYFAYTRVSAFASEIDAITGTVAPPTPTLPTDGVSPTTPSVSPVTTPTPITTPVTTPTTSVGLRPGTTSSVSVAPNTIFGVGADVGSAPTVQLRSADGQVLFDGLAYSSSFRGGVRTTVADVTGDGIPDLITAPGPGSPSVIKVFSGADGTEVRQFMAFESSFLGGAYVKASDLNGDGHAEIIVSADQGGGSRILVFDGAGNGILADFLGIEDTNFRGGARIGLGDINGDGIDDLMVGAGFGGGPRVAIFDGASLGAGQGRKLVSDFFVFEPTLRNGVFLDGGDFDGDGKSEVIVGGGPGGAPRVLVISGANLLGSFGQTLRPVANFFAGDVNFRGGIRVAARDVNGNGIDDLIVAPGEGGGNQVRIYDGVELLRTAQPTPVSTVQPFGGIGGGLFVG